MNRNSLFAACLILVLALLALMSSHSSHASALAVRYEYYRDVYGNGQWGWSSHNYLNYSQAVSGANSACRVGTRVKYIGRFDDYGRLLQRWDYRCR